MNAETKKPVSAKGFGTVIVLGALVVLAAVLGVVFALGAGPSEGGLVAKVTVDGQVEATLPLNQSAREVVETDEGTNTVVVENESVHIEDADCRGHDCMKQGTISRKGQMLVCLPHKLIVEIVSTSNTAPSAYTGSEAVGEYDAVSR